jgi:hypothetical protein
MRRTGVLSVTNSQAELVWLPPVGVAAPAVLCHFDEPKRAKFADRWCDGVPVNAVADEIVERHRQLAVVLSAMMRNFYLDAGEHPMCRQGEHTVSGRFQHLDVARRELAGDPGDTSMSGATGAHGSLSARS